MKGGRGALRPFSISFVAAVLLLAKVSVSNGGTPQPDDGIGASENWSSVAGGADEASYSRLGGINTTNIGKLGLASFLDLPGEVGLEATPLAVNGVLYFTGSYAAVYAVDGVTGKLLWRFDPETWKHHPDKMHLCFGANRGVAYENGRIFVAALDGRLFALDAKTGKALWVVETIDPEFSTTSSTGAPRILNGKVIIGNGGADLGARGYVTAYDCATGRKLWRFYTVPGNPAQNKGDPTMEAAAKTWGPDFWKHAGGGGTVWNGMTFDAEMNRVYIGVGNAGPWDAAQRDPGSKGDNLYLASIVALDADTGKYRWHYQESPREAWDHKATPNIVMATLKFKGRPTKVLLHVPTNGYFYVLDRETGKPISAAAATINTLYKGIDPKTWRPIENDNIRYEKGELTFWPGSIGGHNWQAMSYSPKTGLAYIPMLQLGTRIYRGKLSEHAFNIMGGLLAEPVVKNEGDGKGSLIAWDPITQKAAWKVQHDDIWNGGTLATAGNLVFQGTADGRLHAYDAANGKELWRFEAGLGITAAPMSWSAGGTQYVSVLVGYGGLTAAYGTLMNLGYKYGAQPRRLLTFALGGKAVLPPAVPRDMKVHALDDPSLTLDEADVEAGWALSVRCIACHGVSLRGAGTPGPDLRESRVALNLDSLRQLLKSGALMPRGMPRFETLSDTEVRQLYAYIRARAREVLGLRKPTTPKAGPARL